MDVSSFRPCGSRNPPGSDRDTLVFCTEVAVPRDTGRPRPKAEGRQEGRGLRSKQDSSGFGSPSGYGSGGCGVCPRCNEGTTHSS